MKKTGLLIAIALITMSACTNDELKNEEITQSNSILIDPFVPKMQKSGDATSITLENGIMIYAYENGKAYTSSPFINGVIFKKTTTYWESAPLYYWPMYALDFYGFYPTSVVPTDIANPLDFTYTVNPSAENEDDVVVAYKGDQTREIVDMQFHHALSKISFTITTTANTGLNVIVNSIALKNILMTADFTLDTLATGVPDYFEVTNPSSSGDATITPTSPVSVIASTTNVTSSPISALYVIPQTLTNWAYTQTSAFPLTGTYININGSLTGVADYVGNIAVPITTTAWQPGYHYIYNIVFGNPNGTSGGGGYNPDQGTDGDTKPEQILLPIQISVTVDTWDEINEPAIDL
ncbi:MAG: fimbrillin family protein [Bacteroidales bacterium]